MRLALGKQETLQLACDLLGRGGVATLLGMAAEDTKVTFDPLLLTVEERRIQGSFYGMEQSLRRHPHARRADQARPAPGEKTLKTRPLTEVNEAIAEIKSGAVGRTVLLNHG